MVERAKEGVLKSCGHMDRISEERFIERICVSGIEGKRRGPKW